MSWFTSLLGGFASGYGYQGLGQAIGGQGLQTTWGQVGEMLGGLSSRGGGSSHPPATPVQTSWDTPPQPMRQRRFQGFNFPTKRRQQFNLSNFMGQGGMEGWET